MASGSWARYRGGVAMAHAWVVGFITAAREARMPFYICVIDCEIDADDIARQPSLEDQAADVLGEHVYELEAPDRDHAEREALETFHREYPALAQVGDRVDLSVVARRRTAGDKVADTASRRGRGRAQADGEPYGGAERREPLFE